jgi:hypothetical protein
MRLDNIKLSLNEDRPSANITSPGPVPINLEVSELIISRGPDGIFHIEPPGDLYLNSYYRILKKVLILADTEYCFEYNDVINCMCVVDCFDYILKFRPP